MNTSNSIPCPKCGTLVNVEGAIRVQLQTEFEEKEKEKEAKLAVQQQNLDIEKAEIEKNRLNLNALIQTKLAEERSEQEKTIRKNLKEELDAEEQEKFKTLQEKLAEAEQKAITLNAEKEAEKDRMARTLQLDREAQEAEMKANERKRRAQLEEEAIEKEKEIKAEAKRVAEEEVQLEKAGWEHRYAALQKQVEEANRKAQQGSMQTQGEVMEILIEEQLRAQFPRDEVNEIKKGELGADCVLRVFNSRGEIAGNILIESKRTKNWTDSWLPKLKEDAHRKNATDCVLVTQATPAGYSGPRLYEGVWVCTLNDYLYVVGLLREKHIQLFQLRTVQEGQGTKMEQLYEYLSSKQFEQVMSAIVEEFGQQKGQIETERKAFEKQWAAREKSLERVQKNLLRFHGSIQGIAGQSTGLDMLGSINQTSLED